MNNFPYETNYKPNTCGGVIGMDENLINYLNTLNKTNDPFVEIKKTQTASQNKKRGFSTFTFDMENATKKSTGIKTLKNEFPMGKYQVF